jgi:hypothetical protein
MRAANFCVECGEPLSRTSWRARFGARLCSHCAQRQGAFATFRPLLIIVLVAVGAFLIGKHLQPAAPPLIIQRAANSPLSDAPVNSNDSSGVAKQPAPSNQNANQTGASADDAVYICGARTKKGTPCHRRVHAAGERCFQHKGMPSLVPLSKLVVRP